jgi:hypothetical protein
MSANDNFYDVQAGPEWCTAVDGKTKWAEAVLPCTESI